MGESAGLADGNFGKGRQSALDETQRKPSTREEFKHRRLHLRGKKPFRLKQIKGAPVSALGRKGENPLQLSPYLGFGISLLKQEEIDFT